jgi:hypothetical protein
MRCQYIEDAVPKHWAYLHRQDKDLPPLIATFDRPTQQQSLASLPAPR